MEDSTIKKDIESPFSKDAEEIVVNENSQNLSIPKDLVVQDMSKLQKLSIGKVDPLISCSTISLTNLEQLETAEFLSLQVDHLCIQNCPKLQSIFCFSLSGSKFDIRDLPMLQTINMINNCYESISSFIIRGNAFSKRITL